MHGPAKTPRARAVYSVFGSMPGLFEALANQLLQALDTALDRIPSTDDPATDIVTASLHGLRRVALQRSALYHLVFSRVVPDLQLGLEFEATAGATYERLRALVTRLVSARGGEPSTIDMTGHDARDAARSHGRGPSTKRLPTTTTPHERTTTVRTSTNESDTKVALPLGVVALAAGPFL